MTVEINSMNEEQLRAVLPLGDALYTFIHEGFCNEGSFLSSIIENDLIRSAQQADHVNKHYLMEYAMYLTWYAPEACYGSKYKHENWEGLNNLN